jgi:hypothetical protein
MSSQMVSIAVSKVGATAAVAALQSTIASAVVASNATLAGLIAGPGGLAVLPAAGVVAGYYIGKAIAEKVMEALKSVYYSHTDLLAALRQVMINRHGLPDHLELKVRYWSLFSQHGDYWWSKENLRHRVMEHLHWMKGEEHCLLLPGRQGVELAAGRVKHDDMETVYNLVDFGPEVTWHEDHCSEWFASLKKKAEIHHSRVLWLFPRVRGKTKCPFKMLHLQ